MSNFGEKVVVQIAKARKETEMGAGFSLGANVIFKNINELCCGDQFLELFDANAIYKFVDVLEKINILFPVVIDEQNIVMAGNSRFIGAKIAGLKSIPTIQADLLTKEQLFDCCCFTRRLEQEFDLGLEFVQLELMELTSIGL
jgi:hypothetical protein